MYQNDSVFVILQSQILLKQVPLVQVQIYHSKTEFHQD